MKDTVLVSVKAALLPCIHQPTVPAKSIGE
ncbi:hypothetical protein BH09VER1_BH09VER1_53880 [soil metagenome]